MAKANESDGRRVRIPKKAALYISKDFKEVLDTKLVSLGWVRQNGSPDFVKLMRKIGYTNRGHFMEVMNGKAPMSIEILYKIQVLVEMDYYIYYEEACEALGITPNRKITHASTGGMYHVE